MTSFTYNTNSTSNVAQSFIDAGGTIAGTSPALDRHIISGVDQWTETTALTSALDAWKRVTDVNFQSTSSSSPSFTVSTADQLQYRVLNPNTMQYEAEDYFGYNVEDNTTSTITHVIINDSYTSNWDEGEFDYFNLLHEIGHVLGLDHPSGGSTDDQSASIMSYNTWNGLYAATPMIDDIEDLQAIHGFETSISGGNDTYTLTGDGKLWTIWDHAGTDEIKVASTETRDATLDLTGGKDGSGTPYWSHVGNEYVAISTDSRDTVTGNVKIENATGGKGADSIIGNILDNVLTGNDGNDTIKAGGGDDELYGGKGNDRYVFDYTDYDSSSPATIEIDDSDGWFQIEFEDLTASAENFFVDYNGSYYEYFELNTGTVTSTETTVAGSISTEPYYEIMEPTVTNGGRVYTENWHEDIDITLDWGTGAFGSGSSTTITLRELVFDNGVITSRDEIATIDLQTSHVTELNNSNLIDLINDGKISFDTTNNIWNFDLRELLTGQTVAGTASSSDIFDAGAFTSNYVTITDFIYGEGDVIDITAFDGQIDELADLGLTDDGNGNTDFTLPQTGDDITVTLDSVSYASVNETYFLSNTMDYGTGSGLAGDSLDNSIQGTSGDDTIWGNEGNDTGVGGTGDDIFYGWTGNDVAWGGYGNDTLNGDDGDDQLTGDAGDDLVQGGAGNDSVYGAEGDDSVNGNDGNDKVWGDEGNDYVLGGAGNDTIYGYTGNDLLYGEADDDLLTGEDGDDYLDGGTGADGLYGHAGADTLIGDDGADWLDGGADADQLKGGIGSDGLTGGAGADIFVYTNANESVLWSGDWIYDFTSGTDMLDLSAIMTGISIIGGSSFSGTAGELRYYDVSGNTVNHLDIDGDSTADFEIVMAGTVNLQTTDLLYN